MMEIAGDIDITFKRVDAPVLVGKTVEDAVGFKLTIGPAGEVFRGAGAEAKRTEFKAAMATAINAQKNDADGIIMDSSSWIISGKNPSEAAPRLHHESMARLARLGIVGELAAVAHELNQPLMAAGTYTRLVADALRSGHGNTDAVAETARKASAQVERAANPFVPLSSTKKEGLGIGLSLCRSLIEAHGGRVWLDAGAPGAVMHFTLPVAQVRSPPVALL
jgi:C4-dicarboxylate-specific signal transduction histidine kinase